MKHSNYIHASYYIYNCRWISLTSIRITALVVSRIHCAIVSHACALVRQGRRTRGLQVMNRSQYSARRSCYRADYGGGTRSVEAHRVTSGSLNSIHTVSASFCRPVQFFSFVSCPSPDRPASPLFLTRASSPSAVTPPLSPLSTGVPRHRPVPASIPSSDSSFPPH
ncbi:hypothetical protein CALCODRAFT_348586 [Calocera cornea HHB12733]|uniref:Uncharacterized protein n=1 Tax=Calocera cornea HHB12733 TaxID=1353952 RepID=A0A165JDA5_9BASI|nr:hypothetical protein CALCODRAFT_348586 [Calocera cornea HHB12733]